MISSRFLVVSLTVFNLLKRVGGDGLLLFQLSYMRRVTFKVLLRDQCIESRRCDDNYLLCRHGRTRRLPWLSLARLFVTGRRSQSA